MSFVQKNPIIIIDCCTVCYVQSLIQYEHLKVELVIVDWMSYESFAVLLRYIMTELYCANFTNEFLWFSIECQSRRRLHILVDDLIMSVCLLPVVIFSVTCCPVIRLCDDNVRCLMMLSENELLVKAGRCFAIPVSIEVIGLKLSWEFSTQPKVIRI